MSILSAVSSSISGGVSGVVSTATKAVGSAFDILDPSKARRLISGLSTGIAGDLQQIPQIGFLSAGSLPGTATSTEDDWRVRISLADAATIFYKETGGNPLMAPLLNTNGVIFPYTPSISVTHSANYGTVALTHANYGQHFYNNSEVQDIQITGEFTVQSIDEGQYLLAAVYFLRSCTKMFFGSGTNVGNPPPIVFLDGYGSHYFPHVPCVITGFTHTLPPESDYMPIPVTSVTLQDVDFPSQSGPNSAVDPTNSVIGGSQNIPSLLSAPRGSSNTNTAQAPTNSQSFSTMTTSTRVPTVSTISLVLKPMYSRKNLHNNFNLTDFAAGKLLSNKTTGTGGFI